jgi:hypothetical protein
MIILGTLSLGFCGFAMAQTVAQKEARAHAEANQAHQVKITKDTCGSDIKMVIEWETFEAGYDSSNKEGNAANLCAMVLDGVRQVCTSAVGKDAVAKGLKEVHCSFDKSISPKLKLGLKSGALTATYSFKMNQMVESTKSFVSSHL